MNRYLRIGPILIISVFLGNSCKKSASSKAGLAGKVAGVPITIQEVAATYNDIRTRLPEKMDLETRRQSVITLMIRQKVALHLAETGKLADRPDIQNRFNTLRDQILAVAYRDHLLDQIPFTSDDKLKLAYANYQKGILDSEKQKPLRDYLSKEIDKAKPSMKIEINQTLLNAVLKAPLSTPDLGPDLRIVGKVDNVLITVADVQYVYKSIKRSLPSTSKFEDIRQRVTQSVIEKTVLVRLAEQAGMADRPDLQQKIQWAREKLLAEAARTYLLHASSSTPVTSQEKTMNDPIAQAQRSMKIEIYPDGLESAIPVK